MSVMEGGDPVMIFAGYPKEMTAFLKCNPGLSSRIRHKFTFPDYTVPELALILSKTAQDAGFSIPDTTVLENILTSHTTTKMRAQQNARLIKNIFDGAINCQAGRLAIDARRDELLQILEEDLRGACAQLRGIGDQDEEDVNGSGSGPAV